MKDERDSDELGVVLDDVELPRTPFGTVRDHSRWMPNCAPVLADADDVTTEVLRERQGVSESFLDALGEKVVGVFARFAKDNATWFVDVTGYEGGQETIGPMDYATACRCRSLLLPMRAVSDVALRGPKRTSIGRKRSGLYIVGRERR